MKTYLAVMFIGAFGCAARFWLSSAFAERYPVFPVGTLVVNIVGCFLIGLFAGMTRLDGGLLASPLVRQTVMIGFIGGFTTFSSFAFQTLALYQNGEWLYGTLNILLSVFVCLFAVWIGQVAGTVIIRG